MADDEASGQDQTSTRGKLFHDAVIFQLKLMADGFRDLVLMPVSLIAALAGLIRGGEQPEREFDQVIQLGRQSEQWINLFGAHNVPADAHPITSIDNLFSRVEDVLKQQYQASGVSERARKEIDTALKAAHEKARGGKATK